jgi:hypothetical protein
MKITFLNGLMICIYEIGFSRNGKNRRDLQARATLKVSVKRHRGFYDNENNKRFRRLEGI